MTNQNAELKTNLFEDLNDEQLETVVGGAVGQGGGSLGTGVSAQQVTSGVLTAGNKDGEAVLAGGNATFNALGQKPGTSSIVGDVLG